MATTYGGRPCVDPARFYRECVDHRLPTDWWGKANHFRLPLGRGPGAGHILLRQSDLDAIGTSADRTLVFSGADRAHRASLTRITLVNARCLSPGGPGQAEAVFLCRVVDRRHHLAKVPVDAAYNVAAADGATYLTQTTNGGTAWTWQEVVDDLVTTLGLTAAQFTLPFAPDGTPENLTYWGGYAWDALCDVLDRVACAAKYDPTTDTFEVVRLGAADAAADATMAGLAPAKLWDGYHLSPERAWRPEKVQVQFIRRPRPTDGSSPYYSADVTLAAAAGVVAGTYVVLKDDLTALGATGAPTNAAALATRAAERAADWLRKREGYERPLTRVYRDFDPAAPGDVLGSTVGAVGYDDRGVWRTELTAEPDGRLEAWNPLDLLPPWFPPDGGTSTVSAWKAPCRAATTANVTLATALENGDTLDGVTLATGDRVLVKDQTSAAENGIYVVAASGAPARATDADAGSELVNATVAVSEGTANADTIWMCYTDSPITVGVTSLAWERIYPTVYEDDDGSPSYFGNTLQFDQDDGFSLSQPSRRVVKVDFTAPPLRTSGFGHDVLGTAYGFDGTTYLTVDDSGATFGVTVPEAGTYLVWYDLSCLVSGHRDDIGGTVMARLYDNTNTAAVSGTERYVVSLAYGKVDWTTTEPPPIPIEEYYGSASSQKVITVTGATAYRVQVKLDRAEVTSLDGTVNGDSQIGYVRLA